MQEAARPEKVTNLSGDKDRGTETGSCALLLLLLLMPAAAAAGGE